jgi:CheY-like chemotaxis protein
LLDAAARAISGSRHDGWRARRLGAGEDSARGDEDDARGPAAAGGNTPLRRFHAKVLLAEDNPVNIEVARELLTAAGCRVSVACNGLEALAQFQDARFDVILMDCQMPIMDGIAAVRKMREIEHEQALIRTPVIAVTANAFSEDRARCLAAGMDDYISKPYSEETLVNTLSRWLPVRPKTKPQDERPNSGQTAAAPTSEEPVIDEGMISALKAGRPDLLARLIKTFLAYAPDALAGLEQARDDTDLSRLSMLAHALKSSSANLGAVKLASLCRDLEQRALAGSEAEAIALVVAIKAAFERVAEALEKLAANLTGKLEETARINVDVSG